MSTNSSWVPNESAQTLFSERCWLQGALVSTLAYGVNVCLYLMTLYQLLRSPDRMEFKKSLLLIIYITVVFIFGTIFMISLAGFTQMAFIDDRNFPGGPSAFESDKFSLPMNNAGSVSFVLANWCCNTLMLWRFKVIYQTSRFPLWAVMLFPCLMFSCSIALGILFIIQVSTTSPYVAVDGVNYTLPYLSVTLVFDMLLTVLIVARLFSFRYRVVSLLGPNYGKQYTSVAAMTIESIALYSVVSLAFLILFGIGNAASQVFVHSLNQIQSIAALMIVFRIARGKGWTTETADRVMTARSGTLEKMRFASHRTSTTLGVPGGTAKNSAGGVELQDEGISSDLLSNESV